MLTLKTIHCTVEYVFDKYIYTCVTNTQRKIQKLTTTVQRSLWLSTINPHPPHTPHKKLLSQSCSLLSFLEMKGILSRNSMFKIMHLSLLQLTLAVRKYHTQVKNMASGFES